jgi:hypothetical protein
MPYARTLRRVINQDLVDQIKSTGKVTKQRITKSKRTPRAAATYRGARRSK